MLDLSTPVQYTKGIGPRLAEVLAGKGIHTVADLLHYLPFRYEDRLNPRGIAELRPGEMATVIAEVRTSGLFRTRRMPIFQMTAAQGRARLKCLWFNGTYLRDRFKPGQMVALYGKVEEDRRSGELQIMQPQFEILDEGSEDNGGDAAEQKLAESLQKVEQQIQDTQAELQSNREKLTRATATKRRYAQAQILELQGELGLLNARHNALQAMSEFVTSSGKGHQVGLRVDAEHGGAARFKQRHDTRPPEAWSRSRRVVHRPARFLIICSVRARRFRIIKP